MSRRKKFTVSPDVATLQARLTEARDVLHDIMINGATRQLRHGMKEMLFSPMTAADLRAYISDLEGQLGIGGRARARRVAF